MTKYQSCRGGDQGSTFEQVVLSGYASDGGMFVPETIPSLPLEAFLPFLGEEGDEEVKREGWGKEKREYGEGELKGKGKGFDQQLYQRVAEVVVSLFVDEEEMTQEDIKNLVSSSFSSFDVEEIVPTGYPSSSSSPPSSLPIYLAELYHGETLAFKDLGLSFLASVLDFFLQKRKEVANIVVATSGDTGSSAIHAIKGKRNMNLFVLYPLGDRISPIQRLQMTTVLDFNIRTIGVEGSSDDADIPLKQVFEDPEFKKKYRLTSINSINWCRILVQIIHYVYSYLKLTGKKKLSDLIAHRQQGGEREGEEEYEVVVSIPCGAIGNLTSGCFARCMGLPLRFISATNENKTFVDLVNNGLYCPPFDGKCQKTSSPAMDIGTPYNIERLVWLLAGNTEKVEHLMEQVDKKGQFSIKKDELWEKLKKWVVLAKSVGEKEGSEVIRRYKQEKNYLLCPHSATGVAAAEEYRKTHPSAPIICLLTAHPAKFPESISRALSAPYSSPLSYLHSLPSSSIFFPGERKDWGGYLKELVAVTSKRWLKKGEVKRLAKDDDEEEETESSRLMGISLGWLYISMLAILVANLFIFVFAALPMTTEKLFGPGSE